MAMYLGKERAVILSQKYTAEKFTIRKTLNFGGLSQSTIFRVKKVKGATVKSKNLIPYPYYETTKTLNGITYTVNADGSLAISGTATVQANFYFAYQMKVSAGTYTVSYSGDVVASSDFSFWAFNLSKSKQYTRLSSSIKNKTFTVDEDDYISFYIVVPEGATMNGTLYPMLNEGETALPYQPYFTGLKHAYINSIKSTGKNLFNAETAIHGKALSVENGELYNNATRFSSDYIAVLSETQYYINWETVRWACCYDANKNFIGQTPYKNNIFTTLERTAYMRITANLDELNTIMLNQGDTASPFEPYKEDTWQLPETLELGEWDELNPQTWEVKKATTYTLVCNGAENWTDGQLGRPKRFNLGYTLNSLPLPLMKEYSKFLSSYYKEQVDLNCNVFGIYTSSEIYNKFGGDVEAWKAHLAELYAANTPLVIEYVSGEPTVEKIEGCPLAYTAFKSGTETVIQGEVDNSQFGAMPTIETGQTVAMELIIGDD